VRITLVPDRVRSVSQPRCSHEWPEVQPLSLGPRVELPLGLPRPILGPALFERAIGTPSCPSPDIKHLKVKLAETMVLTMWLAGTKFTTPNQGAGAVRPPARSTRCNVWSV
jgi:hypothetical protein